MFENARYLLVAFLLFLGAPGAILIAQVRNDATVDNPHNIVLWNTSNGDVIRVFRDHNQQVQQVVFSPDEKLLASASLDATSRIWNLETGLIEQTLVHQMPVNAVAFSPNGALLATASFDGATRIWDVKNGRLLSTLNPGGGPVIRLQFSGDSKMIATTASACSRSVLQLFNVQLWASGGSWADDPHRILSIDNAMRAAINPAGTALSTVGPTGRLKAFEIASGKTLFDVPAIEESMTGSGAYLSFLEVKYSPDGRKITTRSANETNKVRVWDAATGQRVSTISFGFHLFHITGAVDFSANSSSVHVVGPRDVVVADVDTGSIKAWWPAPDNARNISGGTILPKSGSAIFNFVVEPDDKVSPPINRYFRWQPGSEVAQFQIGQSLKNFEANSYAYAPSERAIAAYSRTFALGMKRYRPDCAGR